MSSRGWFLDLIHRHPSWLITLDAVHEIGDAGRTQYCWPYSHFPPPLTGPGLNIPRWMSFTARGASINAGINCWNGVMPSSTLSLRRWLLCCTTALAAAWRLMNDLLYLHSGNLPVRHLCTSNTKCGNGRRCGSPGGSKTLKIPVKDCEHFAVYRVKVGEK